MQARSDTKGVWQKLTARRNENFVLVVSSVGRSAGYQGQSPWLASLVSAPESAHQQWGGSSHRTGHWLSVAEGNCVAERRGGEQPEANDQSIIKRGGGALTEISFTTGPLGWFSWRRSW
jgi:hypothetical protein